MIENGPAGTTIVALDGEFDIAQRERMNDAFGAALDSALIVLDLKRTKYFDSVALGCIMRLKKNAADRGGALVIVGASDFAKRVFRITKFDQQVEIRNSLGDIDASRIPLRGGIQRIELVAKSLDVRRPF